MSHTLFPCLFLAAGAMSLTSCETTGDPTQGGLFGWSQQKANVRIDQRQRELNYLEGDNYHQQRRTESLEAQQARLKRAQ